MQAQTFFAKNCSSVLARGELKQCESWERDVKRHSWHQGAHPQHHAKAVDVNLLVAARAHEQLGRGIRERALRRDARRQVAGVHDARQAHVRCRSQHVLSAAGG